jgi:glucose/arabinose dehydrogenase
MRSTTRAALLGFPLIAVLATSLAACGGDAPQVSSAPGTLTAQPEPPAETEPEAPPESQPQAQTETQPRAAAQKLRLVRVASGLDSPTHLAAPSSEPNRLYVVEQAGTIRVIENGKLLPTPFLDIRALVRSGGEQGLLSVAFHPDYASNRLFYVDYTNTDGDTRVVEYRSGSGGAPQRVRELLAVEQPYPNHKGGQLAFGPDGKLYVGMGDGGSGGDPENRAQNLSSQLGKLLRLDVDNAGADWEIAGYGLRNPWRFSFDRKTDDLYIGDVGQGEWEEIDYLPASRLGELVNYGWDVLEGSHSYEDKQPNSAGALVGPIFEYDHGQGCSVTGGFVYRGTKVPPAQGRYFLGDYCSGRIWSLVVKDGKATRVKRHPFTVDQLSSFGENARGELFLVSQSGTIYRLARG